MALVTHALSGGRRDFSAIGGMRADRYEAAVEESVADEAAHLLGELTPSGRGLAGGRTPRSEGHDGDRGLLVASG
jgi:hypothetical protein